jgi:hypothetical protein
MSINNAGVITGFYDDPNFGSFGNGAVHGFVRRPDGTFTTFDAPFDPSNPTPGTIPYSINSAGQIAGRYWICNIQDNAVPTASYDNATERLPPSPRQMGKAAHGPRVSTQPGRSPGTLSI